MKAICSCERRINTILKKARHVLSYWNYNGVWDLSLISYKVSHKNFIFSQKFRDECQKLKMETEKITNLLREKEIELDSCQKVVAMQNVEIGHLQSRIAEVFFAEAMDFFFSSF